MPRTPDQIRDELKQRAIAKEQNVTHPGEPTLTGWLLVILEEIVDLRAAVETEEDEGTV